MYDVHDSLTSRHKITHMGWHTIKLINQSSWTQILRGRYELNIDQRRHWSADFQLGLPIWKAEGIRHITSKNDLVFSSLKMFDYRFFFSHLKLAFPAKSVWLIRIHWRCQTFLECSTKWSRVLLDWFFKCTVAYGL